MEERIIDDPRKIKVKRNAAGGIADATDELAPGEEAAEEEELEIALPEGEELDEDLIGLAPSQLEKELARRKKEAEEAAAERDALLAEGEKLLKAGKYRDAENFFAQALVYDGAEGACEKLWLCRTRNYTGIEPILSPGMAEEFASATPEAKEMLRAKLGGRLQAERDAIEEEAAPLREKVRGAQKERRSAFIANRNYYRWRLLVFGVIFCAFVIAMSVCGSMIVHVRVNTPVYLTIAFGALALLDLIPIIFFSRKLVVAQRLVSDNEKLSSTEDGARLEELEGELETLSVFLEG